MDKLSLTARELDQLLEKSTSRISTSQPTQQDMRRMYEFLGTHFEQILAVHLGGKLSGTCQGAITAAQATELSDRLSVIDTGSVSVGQGLTVRHAALLAKTGLKGAELTDNVTDFAASIRSFALVTDLESAVRSGRLQPGIKRLADWLRLVPVLHNTSDGRIAAKSFLLGKHNLIERFAHRICRDFDSDARWEFAIAHGYADKSLGEQLAVAIRKKLPQAKLLWHTEIGAALGVHIGMGSLIVAIQPATDSD